jgi:1,4-dihydroxy-2-naphthoate octaprenyltransferase
MNSTRQTAPGDDLNHAFHAMLIKGCKKTFAWVKTMRPQFYIMALIGYTMGVLVAYGITREFNLTRYILGYIFLFLVQLSTVFTNNYYDYDSDRINRNSSVFTGGSRTLVEGKITISELKKGIIISLFAILILSIVLLLNAGKERVIQTGVFMCIGLLLGLGYTVPPLKLCYRGLGEFDVGLFFSFYVIHFGYILQRETWSARLLWWLGIPLFFSTFAAITLSGIPDRRADQAVSKQTIAVRLGSHLAAILSLFSITLAAITGVLIWYLYFKESLIGIAILFVLPHSLFLWIVIITLINSRNYDTKINGIMILSLTYILWFGIIPLLYILKVNILL